ncbi:MAG: tetratricopeptide repeat protein [Muribaculum sp.]|nr:tetratricopeptide repeat protein [Muribaculum sp.]
MKNIVYALILLLVGGMVPVRADEVTVAGNEDYFEYMGKADTAIAEGDWESAERYLLDAIMSDPTNPTRVMILSNLGLVQFNLGRDSLAINSLNEAHKMAPRSVKVLANRAEVLMAMGNDEAAYSDYDTILSLDSLNVEARYIHSLLGLRLGLLDSALEDARELEAVDADSYETHLAYGSYYTAVEDWALAAPHYTALILRQPSAFLYCARAVCYLMLDRLNEASSDISSGLELDPENSELYFYRAHLNKKRFQTDDARADMRRSLELKREGK